jgi:hypothetical protein
MLFMTGPEPDSDSILHLDIREHREEEQLLCACETVCGH